MAAIYRPGCPGLSADDLEKVFSVCDTCRRVYLQQYHSMHDCTDLGLTQPSQSSRNGQRVSRGGETVDDDYEE